MPLEHTFKYEHAFKAASLPSPLNKTITEITTSKVPTIVTPTLKANIVRSGRLLYFLC
ncbi:MAG: hypothetical protein ACYCQJ_03315 [Nitrososphaerales archaeon]